MRVLGPMIGVWPLFAIQNLASAQSYIRPGPPQILPVTNLLDLDFSSDGTMLVTGGDSVRVYDVKSWELLHKSNSGAEKQVDVVPNPKGFTFPPWTRAVAFSPIDNYLFAAAGTDGVIRLWEVGRPDPVLVLRGHAAGVKSIAFSLDGLLLVSGATRYSKGYPSLGELKIWDTATGEELRSVEFLKEGVGSVAFSEDGQLLAFSLKSGGVCIRMSTNACMPTGRIWIADLTSDNPPKRLKTGKHGYFSSASLSPKAEKFATGATIERVRKHWIGLVELESKTVTEIEMRSTSGKILWRRDVNTPDPHGVTLSPDGKLVGFCSENWIYLLNAESGDLIASIDVDADGPK
jgi:WD40 repeat protein